MIAGSSGCRRLNCGFTLIELIAVIFVLSLLFAVSLPSFTYIGGRVKSDARRVASILRYLNETAITTKEEMFLRILFKENLLIYRVNETEKRESFKGLSGVELQSKGRINEGEVTIFFGVSGALESFSVFLEEGRDVWIIALNNISGRVSVSKRDEK